jgi:ribonucleoside-triphosphate reductase
MELLSKEFLEEYGDTSENSNELGEFVYYRTYSRYLPQRKRRETWKETCTRAVEYNMGIVKKRFDELGYDLPNLNLHKEAEALFDNMFHLRQFLSGRTLWVGGAESGVADKFPLANFNCSFLNIESWHDMGDLFYLLLVGTGVGFRCSKGMAQNLPPIRNNVKTEHSKYEPVAKSERLEHTKLQDLGNGYAKIYVGDSKEGWVSAIRTYFNLLTSEHFEKVHTIKISYNSIRPKGERLNTFGGSASGHESLLEMFEGVDKVLKNELDPHLEPLEEALTCHHTDEEDDCGNETGYVRVRPIHILDIGNLIGNNVVVGGVRRTAEIFLCDEDDWECILAKYGINGIWDDGKHVQVCDAIGELLGECPKWLRDLPTGDTKARPLHHRRMSNNSIAFEKKPSREMLNIIFTIMQGEGEPGFVNLEEANRRRPNAKGVNPCAEILLDSYGVCNLTTVNVRSFIVWDEEHKRYDLDLDALIRAQALSARAGLRMTMLDLELPHWDKVQKRDRLLGTSLTGWKDTMALLEFDEKDERRLLEILRDVARDESASYARVTRIPVPLLTATVKPEGTLSQRAGGVSEGLHYSHSPYYIRRIRVNASDAIAKVAIELGWTVNSEVGNDPKNPRTLVVDFPVKSGGGKTKGEVTIKEQFDNYLMFQEAYTDHNSSNTIDVKPDEWEEAEELVWNNWEKFVGVSFLAYNGGNYELAPYEEITEEQYDEMKAKMKPFDASLLEQFEDHGEEIEIIDDGCATGSCPVR